MFWSNLRSNRIESDQGFTIEFIADGRIAYVKYSEVGIDYSLSWERLITDNGVEKINFYIDDVSLWEESFINIRSLPKEKQMEKRKQLGNLGEKRVHIDYTTKLRIVSNIKRMIESLEGNLVNVIVIG